MRVQRRRGTVAVLAAAALVALTLTGCGDDDDGEADAPGDGAGNTVRIEETEYAYAVTGEAREGWVTVDVDNTGDEYHMIAIGRMRAGVTLDQVRETVAEAFGGGGEGEGGGDVEPAPEDEGAAGTLGEIELISAQEGEGGEGEGGEDEDPFALLFEDEPLGAPGGFTAPGESFTVTTELEPGDYALMCFIPTPDGASDHFSEGMLNSFTVEEADEPVTTTPEADVEVTIADGSIDMPEEIAGDDTLEVHMTGSEHELTYVRLLDEDASMEELDAYFARFDEEPLPTRDGLEDGPGVIELFLFSAQGDQHFFIRRSLDPGVYYIGCGLDEREGGDTGEGRDHGETETRRVTVT